MSKAIVDVLHLGPICKATTKIKQKKAVVNEDSKM